MELALDCRDRKVIDAGNAPAHQSVLIELPVLVSVAAKPLARVIVPFVGKANGDPVALAFVTIANCKPAVLGLQHHLPEEDGVAVPNSGYVVLCAHFTVGLRGAGPVIDLLREPLVETGRGSPLTSHAMDLMIMELRQPGLGSLAMIRALLLQCLIDTLRRRVVAGDDAVAWILALADRRLWPALSAILDAPGAEHTVESLAERVGMSRSRFAERFQRSFGSSPLEVVRGLRLQFAARLLLDSDAGVARIAERAGYSSRSHFSQQFETVFGESPGRYRKHAARNRALDSLTETAAEAPTLEKPRGAMTARLALGRPRSTSRMRRRA